MQCRQKKEREREIFDLVYGDRFLKSVIEDDPPDFRVDLVGKERPFGVEIVEFYTCETSARLERIRGYTRDLLDGKDFRHKSDREILDVGNVDILSEKNEVKAKDVAAIIQRIPPLADCARMMAGLIASKSEKFRFPKTGLSHTNLIVRDRTGRLDTLPSKYFYPLFFVGELKDAIAASPFREVYLIAEVQGTVRTIRLNMLHMLSDCYFFNAVLARDARVRLSIRKTNSDRLFAAWYSRQVRADVFVRRDTAGTEIICRDTGLFMSRDRSVSVRMYWDGHFPSDAIVVQGEEAAHLGDEFGEIMEDFARQNTFVTELWFPVAKNQRSRSNCRN